MRFTQKEKSRLEGRLSLFFNAFQHSTDAIILTDLSGIVIEANQAFTEMFGWTREEAVGKRTSILRSAKTTDEFYRQMWEAVNQKGRWQGEIINRHRDGSEVPVLLSITSIYQDGERIGYMGVEIDITEKKRIETQLRTEKEFSESIIDTANSLIVGLDLQGRIILFNKKCEEVTGYAKPEVLGKNWFELFIPERNRPDLDDVFKAVLAGDLPSRYENNILTKTGAECLISWSNTAWRNEKREIAGVLAIGIDITELKSLEKQVLQASAGRPSARWRPKWRTRSNQLSSISLNAELLEDEIAVIVPPTPRRPGRSTIISEVDRVTALTEEYLRFRACRKSIHKGSLEQALDDVLELLRHDLQQKKIEVQLQSESNIPETPFDRAQIRRVFLNIIRNAMEAMPKGGQLKIWTEEKNDRAVVHIADTGVGIPEETMARIFEPFFTTKDFGTGLGLAIVQQIIDEHNGQIFCQSKVGEGTTFSIALPLNEME
jgi:PAS domain S-box-containing protein